MSIYIREKGCFGAGIVTLKSNLLNRRLEAEQSKALPPQDLNRQCGTPEHHLYPCDVHIHHLETQKLCVLTCRGAVTRTQLDFSTRTLITFITFSLFLFIFFLPTQILQEKWCFCFQTTAIHILQVTSSVVHRELRVGVFTRTVCP